MSIRRLGRLGLCAVVTLACGGVAWATIDNAKSYKAAYPGKDPKAYSCKTCHNAAIGKKGDLNLYGQALRKHKASVDAKKLTVEDYRAIEAEDADADGASNKAEIDAGTNPGDPASVPAGTKAPAAATGAAGKTP